MELVIRMKSVTRFLIFMAAVLVWLIVLVLLNATYLGQDDNVIVAASVVLSLLTTWGLAFILKT